MTSTAEKAKELVKQFSDNGKRNWSAAKECAIILCDNSIADWKQYKGMYDQEFFDRQILYWQSVRQAITQL